MFPSLLTALCFALAGISARQSTLHSGPLRANVGRLVLGLLILSGIALLRWQGMSISAVLRFAAAGAIGFGIGGYCMMLTLRRLGTPTALLLVESCTAVLAGLLAWFALGDVLAVSQILACLTILAGVLIAGSGWIAASQPAQLHHRIAGYGFGILASASQAVSLVLSRQVFLQSATLGEPIDKLDAAWIRLIGGALLACLILLTLRRRNWHQPHPPRNPEASAFRWFRSQTPLLQQPLTWMLINALMGPVMGVTCWLWAVSLLNPGIVQSIAATAPLISLPIARCLEREPIGIAFFIGAPVAIIGTALLALA